MEKKTRLLNVSNLSIIKKSQQKKNYVFIKVQKLKLFELSIENSALKINLSV